MIAIIADTHDNIPNIKKIVALLKKRKPSFVIHLGDVIAPRTVGYFQGLKMKFIYGNCDGDRLLLRKKVKEIGGMMYGNELSMTYAGKKIYAIHKPDYGDKVGKYDYILHGHTHIPLKKRIGKTIILNPGGHYLGDPKRTNKVILLDMKAGKAEFVQVW